MSDLRKAFWEEMGVLANEDPNVVVLTGDLGYSFMESYAENHPKQFINCGIAEQNMLGVAAGLARAGKKPYVYSGALFIVGRAYEQLRDDIAYQNLHVKLIGTGASGFLGFTHNFEGQENVDDLLKNLPNLSIRHPQNEGDLQVALRLPSPTYIQL